MFKLAWIFLKILPCLLRKSHNPSIGQSNRQLSTMMYPKLMEKNVTMCVMSNNLKHDQLYVFVSLTSVLDTVEVKKYLVLVESDNCTSQYQSVESFYDLQYISDTYNVNLISKLHHICVLVNYVWNHMVFVSYSLSTL